MCLEMTAGRAPIPINPYFPLYSAHLLSFFLPRRHRQVTQEQVLSCFTEEESNFWARGKKWERKSSSREERREAENERERANDTSLSRAHWNHCWFDFSLQLSVLFTKKSVHTGKDIARTHFSDIVLCLLNGDQQGGSRITKTQLRYWCNILATAPTNNANPLSTGKLLYSQMQSGCRYLGSNRVYCVSAQATQLYRLFATKHKVWTHSDSLWISQIWLCRYSRGTLFYLHSLCAQHSLSAFLFHPVAHFNWQPTECHLTASFILSNFLLGCSFMH